MRKSAQYLVGEHNFSAFKSDGSSATNFVRTIYSIEISQQKDVIEIEVTGNGFLYNMVRIIAGTLIDAGKGVERDIKAVLESEDRTLAGPTAPAQGLFLKEVIYE